MNGRPVGARAAWAPAYGECCTVSLPDAPCRASGGDSWPDGVDTRSTRVPFRLPLVPSASRSICLSFRFQPDRAPGAVCNLLI